MGFAVGDLVVCVSHKHSTCRGHVAALARGEARSEKVAAVGRVYRVSGVVPGPFPICDGPGLFLAGTTTRSPFGVCAGSFRKLNDEPDNAELIERIKSSRRIKSKERA